MEGNENNMKIMEKNIMKMKEDNMAG